MNGKIYDEYVVIGVYVFVCVCYKFGKRIHVYVHACMGRSLYM